MNFFYFYSHCFYNKTFQSNSKSKSVSKMGDTLHLQREGEQKKKKRSLRGPFGLFGIMLGQSWLTDPHLFPWGQKSHFCHY